jgi:hypothetical protein
MSEMYRVRIKPRLPHRPHVKRWGVDGKVFEAGEWYPVTAEMASNLKNAKVRNNDPDSPKVFDVFTDEEARAVVEEETRAVRAKADPFARSKPIRGDREAMTPAPQVEEGRSIDDLVPSYDGLSVSKASKLLDGLTEAELRFVLAHERRTKNRKTMIAHIADLLE